MTPRFDIPLIDIAAWRSASPDERAALAARLDDAMQTSGFFLVAGHGIDPELAADVRRAASRFFSLPFETKAPYRTYVGGRGWLATGDEANSYDQEAPDASKADMKESVLFGRARSSGDAEIDAIWFRPNVWPAEVPELAPLASSWLDQVAVLYEELLTMLAAALGLPDSFFVDHVQRAPQHGNINRYPPMQEVGAAQEGQFRVGAHTDWGMLTILDRQPGFGGLQVQRDDGEWIDAPFVEGAFTVNIGDLLARWTGDRWRSTRHRVLPPSDLAPSEELISLIGFMGADMDHTVEALEPPLGRGAVYEPIVTADYYARRAGLAQVAPRPQ